MSRFLPVCLALLLFSPFFFAAPQGQPEKTLAGLWEGELPVGVIKLRLGLTVKKDKEGKLSATLDSFDQGAKGIPVGEVSFDKNKAFFDMPKLKAKYTATMDEEGKILNGDFEQLGQKFKLKMTRVEVFSTVKRPQEPKKPYPYEEEEVEFENTLIHLRNDTHEFQAKIKLAGTLTRPKGKGPFPAVVLVSGSGPQDRDESLLGHKPFLVLADYLTKKGIAVLRYDDRGVGKSKGKHQGATTHDFATDAYSAVAWLQGRKEINPKKIGVMGHSEGGVVAPIVAADHPADVAFIVLLAGTGIPGHEIIQTQSTAILKASKVDEKEIATSMKFQKSLLEIVQNNKDSKLKEKIQAATKKFIDGLTPDEKTAMEKETDIKTLEKRVEIMADPWYAHFIRFDPRPTLSKVKSPVLAINGELDLQVLPENLPAIEKAVKSGGNNKVETRLFPKLNHLFQHAKTGLMDEYGKIEETFSPEAMDLIANWILKN